MKYKEPWQMTIKEFASPPELPKAKDGNVIVYHVLYNEDDLSKVLKEGLLTSNKTAGGEGPTKAFWASKTPTGWSSGGTVIGIEVPKSRVQSTGGGEVILGDVSPKSIVYIDKAAKCPLSSGGRLRDERDYEEAGTYHKAYVRQAILEGKNVPNKVRRDYGKTKQGAWAQQVVYHGKYENTDTGKKFGGKHYGTKYAAEDRLSHIAEGAPNIDKLGKPVIRKYIFDDEKIYGKDEPLNEFSESVGKKGNLRLGAEEIGRSASYRNKLKRLGYKGIAYINDVEDIGSVSYLVWDKKLAKEVRECVPEDNCVRKKDGSWAQQVVYHGKYENTETGKRFGGKHYGTKKAAEDRLRDILESTMNPDARVGLGKPVIKRYIFDDEKIFGRKEPIAEGMMTTDRKGTTRDMLKVYESVPVIANILKRKGYKGIAYINVQEDPGSVSYLLWDKDLVREAKKPIPIELVMGTARSIGGKVKKKVKSKVDDVHYEVYKMKAKAGKVR